MRKQKAESRKQKAVNCLGGEGRRKQETGNREQVPARGERALTPEAVTCSLFPVPCSLAVPAFCSLLSALLSFAFPPACE
jgi:hypothetical protein